jgi:hypothetical protein
MTFAGKAGWLASMVGAASLALAGIASAQKVDLNVYTAL